MTTSVGNTSVGGKPYSYDQTPYESYPFQQSHPNRLATMARLFGMSPQAVEKCRVLELGCASGGNLIPMAFTLPESNFLGVELSKKQVDLGHKTIKALGLKNIEIKQMDIMDVNKDSVGTFDYIIAHGVYSWVPNQVQEKVLQIMQECLNPNGVAYISYNTYPGWHHRGMLRDMMLYHTDNFRDPNTKARQARALLDFLKQSVPSENIQHNAFGIMLQSEVEMLGKQKDYYLLHDYLEEANNPVYFHQFMAQADKHELQYLGEADFNTMLTSNFSKQVADTLRQVSNDIIKTEQYMDFVRNRAFRQTLLCKKNVPLNRNITGQSIMQFFVSTGAKPESEKFEPKQMIQEKFSMPDGKTLTSATPIVRAAFHYLAEIAPKSVAFDDLLTSARAKLSSERVQDSGTMEQEKMALAQDILNCYTVDLVQLHSFQPPFSTELKDCPKVSELVRYMAENFPVVTNQLHQMVPIDVFASRLLAICDGTRNQKKLLDEIVFMAKKGELVAHKDGKAITNENALRDLLKLALQERLALFPNAAILVD